MAEPSAPLAPAIRRATTMAPSAAKLVGITAPRRIRASVDCMSAPGCSRVWILAARERYHKLLRLQDYPSSNGKVRSSDGLPRSLIGRPPRGTAPASVRAKLGEGHHDERGDR